MSERLRLGLIGCGRIAEAGYLPAVAAGSSAVVAAVADPVPDRRDELARACGAATFASAEELVASGAVDAVVVVSPPAEHLAHASLAAAAGLPCLVEKPPATDAQGAVALAALDPPPWIGFNRRFQQGAELQPKVPRDGELELEMELSYRRRSWGAHQVADEPLLDLAPHLVDLALVLAGPEAEVRAATASAERCALVLDTSRGMALIRCATDRPHLERVVVRRAGGPVVARSSTGGLVSAVGARLRRANHPLVASLERQLAAFAAAVRGGDPGLLATAQQGARVMATIDAAGLRAAGQAAVA